MQAPAPDRSCQRGRVVAPGDGLVVDDVVGARRRLERGDDRRGRVVDGDGRPVGIRTRGIEEDALAGRAEHGIRVIAVGRLELAEPEHDTAPAVGGEAKGVGFGRAHGLAHR